MSKELEALERLYKCNDDDYTMGYQHHDYKLLQEALHRLESIDNTSPSEAMVCLEELRDFRYGKDKLLVCQTEMYKQIKQALLKAQEQDLNYNKIAIPFLTELAIILGINDIDEMLDKIKEQKKVLEVIKNKIIWVENDKLMCGRYADTEIEFEEDDFENSEEFELVKRYADEQNNKKV